ncbi:patatin-like phospholipase family protein, partial [Oceanispirochaeta sp.]|uniref:patatin-like phospholipase family protein n=1 Tax=Oceanispirochaeta sp. TaxID=2035350 RepID=UPI00262AE1EB
MFKKRQKEKYCLVLSGGGAKGVYHLGAWKALSELGIEVDAFIGNSIGAIVAGFLAQGQTRALENIGDHIG